SPFGEEVTLPVIHDAANDRVPRFQILYFFDTDCIKCKVETAMLRSLLDDKDYPVDVYAIYVGKDSESWMKWRGSTFVLKKGKTSLTHLWDPDDSSGFQLKYGVTVTPRMFLVGPDGTIVGRGLDTDSLEQLLGALISMPRKEYEYGSGQTTELFDNLFSTYGQFISAGDVLDVASLIRKRTLEVGDTLSFKHMAGDLLYYLTSKKTEGFRDGTALFINDYILSKPEIWNTSDDELKVVGLARMLDDLYKKAPVGAIIPKTAIKGWNKIRRKGGFLVFGTKNCPVCASETAAAEYLHLAYLKVDMDDLEKEAPQLAGQLLEFFDLSTLPQIIQVDKKGVIKRRYLSLSEHLLFLKEKE
ncbi:MAG: thioredoxin family protein, partial [Bacteroidales bacterium]|nr:thioredoxin family protein [Bacteroidales bacterium]